MPQARLMFFPRGSWVGELELSEMLAATGIAASDILPRFGNIILFIKFFQVCRIFPEPAGDRGPGTEAGRFSRRPPGVEVLAGA